METMRFTSILADGKFHEQVDKDTEGAVLREYETSDGKKGEKYELVYGKLENVKITNIQFWDGDFGEQIQITFEKDGTEITLSQNTKGNFGESILKSLPNLDFDKPLSVQPYSFVGERDGKDKRGVSFFQTDKVFDFFYDWENKKALHGYPEVPKDREEMKSDDWLIFFTQARGVMVEYVKKNIVPKFPGRDFKPRDIDPFAVSEVKQPEEDSEELAKSMPF